MVKPDSRSLSCFQVMVGPQAPDLKNRFLAEVARIEGYEPEKVMFYARETSRREIEQEVRSLSFSKRVFVFKDEPALKKDVREYLVSLIESGFIQDYVVFEAVSETDAAFMKKLSSFKKIASKAVISGAASKADENVFFDMVNAVRRGDAGNAVTFIGAMFSDDSKNANQLQGEALRLLKGLTTMLGRSRSTKLKRAYFRAIFDTDRILKESLLEPRIAMERLMLVLAAQSRNIR